MCLVCTISRQEIVAHGGRSRPSGTTRTSGSSIIAKLPRDSSTTSISRRAAYHRGPRACDTRPPPASTSNATGWGGENVIEKLTERLLGDKTQPRENRAEALKWVVQHIPDMHQPLHCDDGAGTDG